MSYIYKCDGSFNKTEDIIEHFNFCFKGICITDENNSKNFDDDNSNDKQIKDSNCPMPVEKECPVCTRCDTVQCPINNPCPVCDETIPDDKEMNDSKISEPYIIREPINESNIINIVKEYLGKLNQFNITYIKKYVLHSNFEDVNNLMKTVNYLNLKYEKIPQNSSFSVLINFSNLNLINDYSENLIKTYDLLRLIPQDIYNFFEDRNIINIPENIKEIVNYYNIEVKFKPKNLDSSYIESFVNINNKITKLETFDNTFDVYGSYLIELFDLKIDEYIYRYLLVKFNDQENIKIYNALEYNIPFEVSINNNNLPPDYFENNKILDLSFNFLQKLFAKPDINSYIYYVNQYSRSYIDLLRDNLRLIEYNEQETNSMVSEILSNKEDKLNELRNMINPDKFGEILDIERSYKFTFGNKVFKSTSSKTILLEEILDNEFLLTFHPGWGDISKLFNINDVISIKEGDTDTANAVNYLYFDYWKVLSISNSTLKLSNVGYFDERKNINLSMNYTYFDTNEILPMPNSLIKARDILTNYTNLSNYDINTIQKFGTTVKELINTTSTRSGSKDDMQYLLDTSNDLASCYDINNCTDAASNLLYKLDEMNSNNELVNIPIQTICDDDPNIFIIKFHCFYIYDLKLSDYKTYRFLRI